MNMSCFRHPVQEASIPQHLPTAKASRGFQLVHVVRNFISVHLRYTTCGYDAHDCSPRPTVSSKCQAEELEGLAAGGSNGKRAEPAAAHLARIERHMRERKL